MSWAQTPKWMNFVQTEQQIACEYLAKQFSLSPGDVHRVYWLKLGILKYIRVSFHQGCLF